MNADNENKYKDALERAKNIYGASESKDILTTLETIFPELKKSQDERIRKAIVELVLQSSEILDSNNQSRMLAWLERQGEQKSINYTDEEWLYFIRWFVNERTNHHTLIPSDDDIQKWGNMILSHAIKVLEKQGEQILANSAKTCKDSPNTAWSKDDEYALKDIAEAVENYWDGDTQSITLDWLKSLKQRLSL